MRNVPRPLLLVSTAVALSLLGDQMLYTVLPVVHESIGIPVAAVGLLLSANRFVRLLTNPLAGYVVGRWGRHWPFFLALLLGGASTVAYGVMYGVGAFLVARLLWGTCWSFLRLEGLYTVLDTSTDATRGRAMGAYQAISRIGTAMAMLLGGVLSDLIGFQATFILFGCITGSGVFLAYAATARHRPRSQENTSPPAASPAPAMSAAVSPDPWPVRWRMIVASLGTFSAFLVVGGLVSATLGYALRSRFGSSVSLGTMTVGVASLTGFFLSFRGFIDLLWAPLAGHWGDRWGQHQTIFVGMPVAVLAVLTLAWSLPLPLLAAVILVAFLASTALNVSFNAVAAEVAPPPKRAMFLSWFVTWQDLGSAAGPLLGYWIAPSLGLFWLYTLGGSFLLGVTVIYIATFAHDVRRTAPAHQATVK